MDDYIAALVEPASDDLDCVSSEGSEPVGILY